MDKRELLEQLRIDRDDEPSSGSARPLKWFLIIAVVGGLAFVAWFFEFPDDSTLVVPTAVAAASPVTAPGSSVLDATGYVVARRQATVSSKVTGKVVEVLIEEGMRVEAGQLLATLDDRIPQAELALAQSRLGAVRAGLGELDAELRQARLDLKRTEDLATRSLASQADLDRDRLAVDVLLARIERTREDIAVAEQTVTVQRRVVDDMQIRAPFTGIVIAKAAQPGEMISPVSAGGGFTRTGICTLVDMDSLEVEVDVNEAYINRVLPGQAVTVTLNAYPDRGIPAEVIAIIPAADRTKATVRVRVALLERDPRVLPDMGVKVAFLEAQPTAATGAPAEAAVTIPAAAVDRAGGQFVWLVRDGTVRRQAVTVGERRGDRVQVVDGLRGGERVVTPLGKELLASLADGRRVEIVN
ncbi:MAG: efflux RND transporter periplasmic adaptor subunit [Pseudomonadales bacterium]